MNITRRDRIQNNQFKISCVVPVYNEAQNIDKFIPALSSSLASLAETYEIIVVNDGSTDLTSEKLRNFETDTHVKWLNFSRNFGKEAALTAGLDHSQGDVTLLIDGDFQHPLDLIPTFLDKWADGHDIVYGTQESRHAQGVVTKFCSKLFYKLMSKISKVSIPPNAGDFRLLDKKAVIELNRLDERERFMKGLYAWVGFSQCAVPFIAPKREVGQSGWSIRKLIELALVGITSFSSAPLRFASFLGLIVSFASFIYGSLAIANTLFFGEEVQGYPTLIVSIMFLGGIQLLSIGILGEYLARIFTEVKQRPNYIVESKKGFDN